ncbi:hypothetical protein GCM10007916_21240 [Psychromonas marina]|uniref:Uncharacterized protein n=1 Tax=Psychromonas marina TaxID=88364 RepID=A0ABQ6E133_9GAMM|nr:hypothetical protein GCM10007916_21240 [Psychromonas marina]
MFDVIENKKCRAMPYGFNKNDMKLESPALNLYFKALINCGTFFTKSIQLMRTCN